MASYIFTYLRPSYKCVQDGLELELPDLSYTFAQTFTEFDLQSFPPGRVKADFLKWRLWTSVIELVSQLPSLKCSCTSKA